MSNQTQAHVADDREHAAFITEYRLWIAKETPDAHPEMVHWMAESHWQRAAGAMWRARAARAAVLPICSRDCKMECGFCKDIAASAPAETPKPRRKASADFDLPAPNDAIEVLPSPATEAQGQAGATDAWPNEATPAMVYGQNGPCEIIKVTRQKVQP